MVGFDSGGLFQPLILRRLLQIGAMIWVLVCFGRHWICADLISSLEGLRRALKETCVSLQFSVSLFAFSVLLEH